MNGPFNFRESTGERYKMGFTNESHNKKRSKKRQQPGSGRRPFGGGGNPMSEASPVGGGGSFGRGVMQQQQQQQQQQLMMLQGPPTLVVPRQSGFPGGGGGGVSGGGDATMLSPNNNSNNNNSASSPVPDMASPLTWARSQFPSPDQRHFQQQHHPRHFPSPNSWKQLKPLGPIAASPIRAHDDPDHLTTTATTATAESPLSMPEDDPTAVGGGVPSLGPLSSGKKKLSKSRRPNLRPRPGQLPVDQRYANYHAAATEGGDGLTVLTEGSTETMEERGSSSSSSSSSSSASQQQPRFQDLLAQHNSDGTESIGAGGFAADDDQTVSTFGAEMQGGTGARTGSSVLSRHEAFRTADPVIEAWCDGFAREGQSFDSFMLFAEVKFNEVLAKQVADHPSLTTRSSTPPPTARALPSAATCS
jgi:hypothetical protein